MNTTAGAVAQELRRVADCLDKAPQTVITRPDLWWWAGSEKDEFLALLPLLPRPLQKSADGEQTYSSMILKHETDALRVESRVYRSAVCVLKTPAREAEYECPALLSLEEEAAVDLATIQPIAAHPVELDSEEWKVQP